MPLRLYKEFAESVDACPKSDQALRRWAPLVLVPPKEVKPNVAVLRREHLEKPKQCPAPGALARGTSIRRADTNTAGQRTRQNAGPSACVEIAVVQVH